MGALDESRIIPDVIDRVSTVSHAEIEVSFGGKQVQNGVTIAPDDAASTPTARVEGGSEGALFALVCTDPDAPDPTNPGRAEWLHWVVTNIPSGGAASQGNEVTSWMGPNPPIGTHRYIFLLYQQPNQEPLQVDDPCAGDRTKRANFKVRKWASAHNLGDPIAVRWFNSHK